MVIMSVMIIMHDHHDNDNFHHWPGSWTWSKTGRERRSDYNPEAGCSDAFQSGFVIFIQIIQIIQIIKPSPPAGQHMAVLHINFQDAGACFLNHHYNDNDDYDYDWFDDNDKAWTKFSTQSSSFDAENYESGDGLNDDYDDNNSDDDIDPESISYQYC